MKEENYSSNQVCKKLHTAGDASPVEFAVLRELREGKVPTKKDSFCFGTPDTEKSDITGSNVVDRASKVPFERVSYEKPT
jgi:hypothetical protein